MIHAYSLVHDDMPCMDDDVLRRGKPTVHVEYDEATALLVGDALQTLAFQLLAEHAGSPTIRRCSWRWCARWRSPRARAAWRAARRSTWRRPASTLSQAELEFMHVRKTGALISAAVKLGALCAGPCPAALEQYAHRVGLAFQVVDDVLDAEASTATLGKTAGKDSKQGKPTYVSAMGVRARQGVRRGTAARRARGAGRASAQRALRLRQLADFIVLRKF